MVADAQLGSVGLTIIIRWFMRLRVSWFPQIPCEPFVVAVSSVEEGVKIMDMLASYDAFQLEHRIKPGYCNAGVLQMFDANDDTDATDGSWVDWCDAESGEGNPRVFLESQVSPR